MPPKISIVISCYNRLAETRQAIDAIRAQDFHDWELIVVDNGCTDNTLQMLTELAADEHRMRVIPLQRSQVAVARMTGIRATHPASGYVVVHDDDDWLFPGALTKLWTLAKANPDAAGVYGMRRMWVCPDWHRLLGELSWHPIKIEKCSFRGSSILLPKAAQKESVQGK